MMIIISNYYHYHRYFYYLPAVDMFPGEFKYWDNTELGTDHQSV